MQKISLDEFHSQVLETKEWLVGAGLDETSYLKNLLSQCALAAAKASFQGSNRELLNAMSDGQELCLVRQAFNDEIRTPIFKQKLSKALAGSATARTTEARNIMFELAFAARLRLNGIEITIGEPDALITMPQGGFFIECKRPSTVASVNKNIVKAARQLGMHYTSTVSHGIVALCISSFVGHPSKIFWNEKEAGAWLADRVLEFSQSKERFCRSALTDDRICGVAYYASASCIIGSTVSRRANYTLYQLNAHEHNVSLKQHLLAAFGENALADG